MTAIEEDLLNMLKLRSFRTGKFVLASGAESNYYIDCRATVMTAGGLNLAGLTFRDRIWRRHRHVPPDAVGGMAVGAVPLVSAIIMASARMDVLLNGFWVRDKPKEHGTAQVVDGVLSPGDRVVIVEDVATTGKSARKAVTVARAAGAQVLAVYALVDRLQGATNLLAEDGIPFESLFTIRDFGIDP